MCCCTAPGFKNLRKSSGNVWFWKSKWFNIMKILKKCAHEQPDPHPHPDPHPDPDPHPHPPRRRNSETAPPRRSICDSYLKLYWFEHIFIHSWWGPQENVCVTILTVLIGGAILYSPPTHQQTWNFSYFSNDVPRHTNRGCMIFVETDYEHDYDHDYEHEELKSNIIGKPVVLIGKWRIHKRSHWNTVSFNRKWRSREQNYWNTHSFTWNWQFERNPWTNICFY